MLLLLVSVSYGQRAEDFPTKPYPPRLVNDFANMMTTSEQDELENLLVRFNDSTSTQISIVTINSLGGYDVGEYTIQLGRNWGIGQKEHDNGVLILASKGDRKMFIASGYGLEGVLTDAMLGEIVRNEMRPAFQEGNFYRGFKDASLAVIQASRNEYTVEQPEAIQYEGSGLPISAIFFLFLVVIILISTLNRRNRNDRNDRNGGGTYMSRRGADIITGAILSSLLNGGRGGGSGGSSWGGGGGFGGGGGGFGGFGGGSFGGGGAGGSW